MANNRLYLGNTETKQYCLFAKGWGEGWQMKQNLTHVHHLLASDISGSDVGSKSRLILFSEYDDIHDQIVDDWEYLE